MPEVIKSKNYRPE